jgi:hypothetical protein
MAEVIQRLDEMLRQVNTLGEPRTQIKEIKQNI